MPEVTFEPFQKVLVRDSENEKWHADLYSYIQMGIYVCVGHPWRKCLPYNDETAHLLGTTDNPTPPGPTFQMGDHVEVRDVGKNSPWLPAVFLWDSDDTYVVIRKGGTTIHKLVSLPPRRLVGGEDGTRIEAMPCMRKHIHKSSLYKTCILLCVQLL